ncbi:MAG: hypothetical protein JWR08_2263 [Enterovirga sp.]|nr:hypothetical protein [Enterovirga sp.]
MTGSPPRPVRSPWLSFLGAFTIAACATVLAGFGAVVALDPFGVRTSATRAATPIMDLNQRYMYPQLVRSGIFDSAVFGSSTVRLLDPKQLDALFGGRFVNLGLNAGTPWEQRQLAELFLRVVRQPQTLVFGLDRTWCDADATEPSRRLTFRSFPPAFYDEEPLNDLPELLSLKALEIASRVLLHRLGLMPERIRGDGYENFLPPDDLYDLARARTHIHAGPGGTGMRPGSPDPRVGFPALAWLSDILGQVPPGTRTILVLPPIHVAAQAAADSPDDLRDTACKTEIGRIAAARRATLVDYRWSSALTREDSHYWDRLHYRQPWAERIVEDLAAVAAGRGGASERYRVLTLGRSD